MKLLEAKQCGKCGSEERHANGRCAPCVRSYCRRYYAANRERLLVVKAAYNARFPERIARYGKDWRAANPEKVLALRREHMLRASRGITTLEYDALLEKQGGTCAVCSAPPNGKTLKADREHDTEKIRGLLCADCNTNLRGFAATPQHEWIRKAASYLEGVSSRE